MASSRHLGRVIALQSLYEYGFYDTAIDEDLLERILKRHLKHRSKSLGDQKFTINLTRGVVAKSQELDALLQPAASQRPLAEIPAIDYRILQISVYELLYEDDVPPKVAINEAVELAKYYGGQNSSKFVNGVLGTIYRRLIQDGSIEAEAQEEASTDDVSPVEKI